MRKTFILLSIFLVSLWAGCNYKTYIPEKAKKLQPIIEHTNKTIMPRMFYPCYFSALIEHESCVRLCGNSYWARRCWSPRSKLKTYWDKNKKVPREEGAGLLQLTRAWTKTGRLRFDTIRNLKRRYPKYLSELTWDNVYRRPDLQIKAGILLWKTNNDLLTKKIKGVERIWFLDSAYNGGFKYLLRERTKCKLMKNCDPNKWFNNVEKVNCRGHRKLYGNRTSWDINRHHVKDVKDRLVKYIFYYFYGKYYRLFKPP